MPVRLGNPDAIDGAPKRTEKSLWGLLGKIKLSHPGIPDSGNPCRNDGVSLCIKMNAETIKKPIIKTGFFKSPLPNPLQQERE